MGSMGSLRLAGPKMGRAFSVIRNCDWWHGQSNRLVCCSYRLAGEPGCGQIFADAVELPHIESLLVGAAWLASRAAAASPARRWISRVGESAYWLVAPCGMPGNTVI